MTREVQVKISLKDAFSAALKSAVGRAKGELAGLASSRAAAGRSSGGDTGGVTAGMIAQGNLLASAIGGIASGVMSAGGALVGAFKDQLAATSEMARGQLGSTSANAAILGIGFKDSAKLTDQISATLAKSAETLPGATKDYLQAFNGVSDTLAIAGGMTKKGLTDNGKEIVELTAMLGQASGSGSVTTSTALGKMVGDTGSESLFRIDAFEKVPAFKAILEKDLEKSGKTLAQFFKLSGAEKLKHLVDVKKALFSPEYIAQMNLAADAQLDTMKSQLFDPVGGVFGFLKKVKVDGKVTTVWAELGLLMGSFRSMATGIISALGLSGDPLVGFIGAIRSVSGWMKSVGQSMSGLSIGSMDVGLIMGKLIEGARSLFGNLVSSIGSAVDGAGGGAAIGFMVSSSLGQTISAMLQGIPGMISTVAVPVIGVGLQFLAGAVVGIFAAIPEIVLSVVIAVGGSVLAWGAGLINGISSWASEMGTGIANAASSMGVGLVELGVGLLTAILGFRSGVGPVFLSGVSQMGTALTSAVSSFTTPLSSVFGGLVDSIKSTVGAITGAIQSLVNSIPIIGKGDSGKSSYSGQHTNLLNRDMMTGSNRIGSVGTAYNGNLLEAINQESRMKPSGSSLVIANSSELIVPRNKLPGIQQSNQISFTIVGQTREQILADVGRQLDRATRLPRLATA